MRSKIPLMPAYKALALQKNITNKKAKSLIDSGLVSIDKERLQIARKLIRSDSLFEITKKSQVSKIFCDENILALNKPAFMDSEFVLKSYLKENQDDWTLLNRLDRETSGIILCVKNKSSFHKKAILAFKNFQVYKEYKALVLPSKMAKKVLLQNERIILNKSLKVFKNGFIKTKVMNSKSKIDQVNYKQAHTEISLLGQKIIKINNKDKEISILKVIIKTGVSHQIRAHLSDFGASILGDKTYGGAEFFRMALHAYKISLLGYEFSQDPDPMFL